MHVAIRADASTSIGHGHVVRCFALAQALQLTGATRIAFLCAWLPEELERILIDKGFEVVRLRATQSSHEDPFAIDQPADAAAVRAWLGEQPCPQHVVVDHYGLDAVWEEIVRPHVGRLLVIDDLANRRHFCDILLDPALQDGVGRHDALGPAVGRRLLGPRFALLRPDFSQLRTRALATGVQERNRVLLFAGGGDHINATSRVLDAWSLRQRVEPGLDVVIGASHPHREEIVQRCAQMHGVDLHVQTDRMAELLASARLFIGAAGGVSWERCCLGAPALMFAAAANQSLNLKQLAKHRTGIALADFEHIEPAWLCAMIERLLARPRLLARMSRRAAALVDGLGAVRAALSLTAGLLTLREARADDDLLVWPWRNDSTTRRFFRDPRPLTLEQHRHWWARSLTAPDRVLFIARCGKQDVGVIRFDTSADEGAEISIYVDPALTGLGLGSALLRAGQGWAEGQTRWRRLEAEILPGNVASEAAFAAVGFRQLGSRWIREIARA